MKIFDDIKQVQGTGQHMLRHRAPAIDLSVATRSVSDLYGEAGIEIMHELRIKTNEIIQDNPRFNGVAIARKNYIHCVRQYLYGEIMEHVLRIFYTDEVQKSIELKADMQDLLDLLAGVKVNAT